MMQHAQYFALDNGYHEIIRGTVLHRLRVAHEIEQATPNRRFYCELIDIHDSLDSLLNAESKAPQELYEALVIIREVLGYPT